MDGKIKETYFLYALLVAAGVVCFLIFLPFVSVMLVGAALAVLLHPVHRWVRAYLPPRIKGAAAGLTVLLALLILAVPITFIVTRVVSEASALYGSLASGGAANQYLGHIANSIHNTFPEISEAEVQRRLGDATGFFTGSITQIFTSTLQTIFSFILVVIALFYFLKEGEGWRESLIAISPLSKLHNERLLAMLERTINGVLTGYVFIGMIQGSLLGFGLAIFGVPNPALWGVLAGFASMIPSIGTALVSVPAFAYLIAIGKVPQAIGFAVWALALVGTVDNFLNPIIVGKRIELPPFVVLFAVLGGVSLLGASGILLGPLAVSFFYALVSIYREEFVER